MHPLKKHSHLARAVAVTASLLFIALFFTLTSQIAFAGKTERAAKCVTKGDAKVSKRIAKKMVAHAIKKYEIADLVGDEEAIKKARKEVYGFLKWKLGNPTAICGQYVTAGQKHFNKAYGDEAAAALMGFDLPNEKAGHSQFYLPPQLVELRLAVLKTVVIPAAAKGLEAAYGIPAPIAEILLKAYAEEEAKVLKRLGFNIPQKYDFPNGLLQTAIDAKRDPQGTRAKLQRVIDASSKQEQSQDPAGGPATKSPAVSDEDEDVTDEEDVADLEDEQGQKRDKDKMVKKKKKKKMKKLPF